MSRKVIIFDTTLRDGEQVPGAKLNTEEKLEIARQLAKLRVDVIEAGFPASSPGDREAVKRVAMEIKGPIITGLARTVKEDLDDLWEALKPAEQPRIHIVLGTSDIHVEKKLRKDREKVLEMGVEAVKYAKKLCPEVEYSTEDASRSDFDYMARTLEEVIKAGATVVNVPDTVGYAIPEQYGAMVKRIKESVPNIHRALLSVHCHNDLGMATANTLAAVKNGVDQVEVTVNGIGERAGNCSLEEVVMAMRTRKDHFDAFTDIDISQIYHTSRLVSSLMGIPVQPNKAIVGSNAFAHSSGIHQDGILKDRSTYEIIRPEDVGVQSHEMILTARSGRAAVRHRLKELGYELASEVFERVFTRFIEVADRKKEVVDEDLESLVREEISSVADILSLESFQAVSGINITPQCAVGLRRNGDLITDAAVGNGPVDAIFKCVDRISSVPARLVKYDIKAVTQGKDALGEAMVQVEVEGKLFTGRASSTDVIEASARAYIKAINKALATT